MIVWYCRIFTNFADYYNLPMSKKTDKRTDRNTDKKKHTHPSTHTTPSPRRNTWTKWGGLISFGVFAVLCYGLLLCFYGDYMHKIESLSMFLPVSSFFTTCTALPGGLLTWLGTFCTMSMHTPWLGAAVYTLLLLALTFVTVKAFSIPKEWMSVAILPSVLILLSFVNFGYLIYTVKPLGYAFSLPLGVLLALLLYWGVASLRQWWLRLVAILVIVLAGYPWLGFYALFAAVLCCIDCLRQYSSSSLILRLIPAVAGIIAVGVVPRLWFVMLPGDLMESQTYISGLPRFFAREAWMWCLYSAVFLSFAVCAIYRDLLSKLHWSNPPAYMWACVCALAVAVVCAGRYSDRNFMLGLRLDRYIWEGEYDRAADTALGTDFKMTRANTLLSYIALIRSGRMGTAMFDIPYGDEPYATTRDARSIFDVCGALASYHLGMPNYGYRWGMEYTLEQSPTVERLKIMTKCALLNHELALARTYLDILYNVPTHRDWAAHYRRYLDNPLELMSDPEMKAIAPLMCHQNEFINDHGSLEGYVWNLLANAPGGTADFNELCMQAALITMDLDAFMRRLPEYAARHPRIPPVYQQAALLWSLLGKQPCPIVIDPSIKAKHEEFLAAFRRLKGMTAEEQREQMSQFFDHTYWYYFIFMSDRQL